MKGRTKYISECHLRGGGCKKGKEMITPGLPTNQCRTELAAVLVFQKEELKETAGRSAAWGNSKGKRVAVGGENSVVFTLI